MSGELSRDTTLMYPQYLWAQVMEQQMGQSQHQVPSMGPEMQRVGPAREEQRQQGEQGEGDPAPSLTSSGPALHHTGTGPR